MPIVHIFSTIITYSTYILTVPLIIFVAVEPMVHVVSIPTALSKVPAASTLLSSISINRSTSGPF